MKKEVENKTVIIKNPSEKMKAFIKKMEEGYKLYLYQPRFLRTSSFLFPSLLFFRA